MLIDDIKTVVPTQWKMLQIVDMGISVVHIQEAAASSINHALDNLANKKILTVCLSDSNGIQTLDHLVRKGTLNH